MYLIDLVYNNSLNLFYFVLFTKINWYINGTPTILCNINLNYFLLKDIYKNINIVFYSRIFPNVFNILYPLKYYAFLF